MKKLFLFLVLFSLTFNSISSDVVSTSIVINITSCNYFHNVDWVIRETCVKVNEQINLGTGRLVIDENGLLVLIDSELYSNGLPSYLKENLPRDYIILTDSNITTY